MIDWVALPVPSVDGAILAMQRLISVAVLIDALEILSRRSDFGPRGVFHTDILRAHEKWSGTAAWVFRRAMDTDAFFALMRVQVVAAAVMFIDPGGWWTLAALALALSGRLLLNLRTTFGLDGSDQMIVIVLCSLTIARAGAGNPVIPTACVAFVAAQMLLAYVTSGVAKLVSPIWRSGEAIPAILHMRSYGLKPAAAWLSRHPGVARFVCRSVIALECALPFAVLTGIPGAWLFVAGAMSFHLGVAVTMGLNTFLWSFASTLPAVLSAASLIQTVPPAWGGAWAGSAGIGAIMLVFSILLARTLRRTALDNLDLLRGGPDGSEPVELTLIGASAKNSDPDDT